MAPPLTLETYNRIVYDTVHSQLVNEKAEELDVTLADFNQVMWHLSTVDGKLLVSVSCKCWDQIRANGGEEYFKKVYGSLLQPKPEAKYDLTLAIAVGKEYKEEEAAKISRLASRMSRNLLASVLHKQMEAAAQRAPGGKLVQVDYRPSESVWFKQDGDRVTVIFSINFDDEDDVVIGRVFLNEFGKNVPGAPACDTYLKDPPSELAGVRGLRAHGYASFLLEARHYQPSKRESTCDVLLTFRNYMHYHIKCSKAYLHIRMRTRVNSLLQVLNRARQEVPVAVGPRQAGGAPKKTFVRKQA